MMMNLGVSGTSKLTINGFNVTVFKQLIEYCTNKRTQGKFKMITKS